MILQILPLKIFYLPLQIPDQFSIVYQLLTHSVNPEHEMALI